MDGLLFRRKMGYFYTAYKSNLHIAARHLMLKVSFFDNVTIQKQKGMACAKER